VAGLVSNALKLVDQSIRFCSRWAVFWSASAHYQAGLVQDKADNTSEVVRGQQYGPEMMIFYQRSNGWGNRSAIPSHHEQLADGPARLVRYWSGTGLAEKTTNRLRSCHGGSVTSIVTSLVTIPAETSQPQSEGRAVEMQGRAAFNFCGLQVRYTSQ
jgi:hypothetical protein